MEQTFEDRLRQDLHQFVLQLTGSEYTALEKMVGECASRVYNALMRRQIET